jgi:hypothetical protein
MPINLPGQDRVTAREVPDMKAEDIIRPLSVFEEYTDEEIMYWATPYFDELQAQKELQKKARENG